MKKLIKLSALSLLMGIGVCSVASANPKHHKTNTNMDKQVVSLIPLKANRGFAVRVDKLMPSKTTVIVYDDVSDVALFKDHLTEGTHAEKKYLLSQLDDGRYTVEVYSKGHDTKTQFYIYTRGNKRIIDIM